MEEQERKQKLKAGKEKVVLLFKYSNFNRSKISHFSTDCPYE